MDATRRREALFAGMGVALMPGMDGTAGIRACSTSPAVLLTLGNTGIPGTPEAPERTFLNTDLSSSDLKSSKSTSVTRPSVARAIRWGSVNHIWIAAVKK